MNQARSGSFSWIIAGVWLVALITYIATRTHVYSFDALSYILSAERKSLAAVLFPHHLLYGPLSQAVAALGAGLGYAGGAALPMQLVSALGGATAVATVFALAAQTPLDTYTDVERLQSSVRQQHRIPKLPANIRLDLGLLAALLVGGALGFWYFSGEADVYALALGCTLLALRQLVRMAHAPTRRDALLLGVYQSLAILLHQSHVLLTIPALLIMCAPPPALFWPQRVQRWWPYPASGIVLVGGAYAAAAAIIGFPDWATFSTWFAGYAATGWWGTEGIDRAADTLIGLRDTLGSIGWMVWLLVAAWSTMLTVQRFRERRVATRNLTTTASSGLASSSGDADLSRAATATSSPKPAISNIVEPDRLVAAAPSTGSGAISRAHADRTLGWALWLWTAVYSVAALWWEPGNPKFWLAVVPVVALLVIRGLQRTRRWSATTLLLIGVAGIAASFNGAAVLARGDARTDLDRQIAAAVAANLTPADLALVPDGLLEVYLPYYHNHDNYVSLNQMLFEQGGDARAACAALQQRVEQAEHAGVRVLVADEVLNPPARLFARFNLAPDALDCLAAYRNDLQPLPLPPNTPTYQRLPTATERALGVGWQFTQNAQGWQAANVAAARFDTAGWTFTPATDPALLGPILQVDAARVQAIEIRLRTTTQARDAQLFYAGPDGAIREQQSIQWTLYGGATPTTYTIALNNAPGWAGTITRLRLDPVGIGDGGQIIVEAIRLIRQ